MSASTRSGFPGGVRSVFLVLTAGCNLSCSYCYQNDKRPRRMEADVLRAALDRVLGTDSPEMEIVFFGGEPLMEFPAIRDAVEYVSRRLPGDRAVRYALITNGMLLKGPALDFLTERGISVQLSFDGVPEAQEARGAGTFRILDARLDGLRTGRAQWFRKHLGISLTLRPDSVPTLARSVEYFLGKGVRDLGLSPVFTDSSSWNPEDISRMETEFEKVFALSLRHHRETGEIPLSTYRPDGGDDVHGPRELSLCGVARGEVPVVDVDGRIHACATFADSFQTLPRFLGERLEKLRLGDVRNDDLSRSFASLEEAARGAGIFTDKHRKYSSYGRCGSCRHLDGCSICPVSIGHIPGNTDPHRVPDFPCAYNLVSRDSRRRFLARVFPDSHGHLQFADPAPFRRIRAFAQRRRQPSGGGTDVH